MEVLPGVHLFKVPIPNNPLGSVNVYLFRSAGECLLVDTGWNTDEAFGALARQLGEAGVSFCDLTCIAITHVHPDHYGLAGRLRQHSGAHLVMHEIERSLIQARYVAFDGLLEEVNQWLRINGAPDEERPQLSRASLGMVDRVAITLPDRPVRGGERLQVGDFAFEIIWTPGHSPGHICLFERERQIFISGDHVLPGISPNISLHSQSLGNPLADYLDALDAVAGLPVAWVLPSHGEPFHDLAGRVAEIRAHHAARKRQMAAALAGGRKTAYEVAGLVPWNTKGVPWSDLDYWVRRSAMMEALAHLEMMRAEGMIGKLVRDGLVWYTPPVSGSAPRN